MCGPDGEVVLAVIMVIPVTQPIDAALGRGVEEACGVLEAGERLLSPASCGHDTRLVRARSLAQGILNTLAAERFDLVVLQGDREAVNGGAAQVQNVLDRSDVSVVIVHPAPAGGEVKRSRPPR
jgi:hypothetical protein